MIKSSIKYTILATLLFVLVNTAFIQPETRALPFVTGELSLIEATPEKVADQQVALNTAVVPVETVVISTTSTEAANSTPAIPAEAGAAPAAPAAAETGTALGAFRATAYCLRGRTANGGGVRRGIVAADPRVLPLGSRIQISGGAYSGTYTVTDTGGVIKGRILDIWVPSCSEAIRFGRRTIHVTVLARGGKSAKKAKKAKK